MNQIGDYYYEALKQAVKEGIETGRLSKAARPVIPQNRAIQLYEPPAHEQNYSDGEKGIVFNDQQTASK